MGKEKKKKKKKFQEIEKRGFEWKEEVGLINNYLNLISCKGLVNDVVIDLTPKKAIAFGVSIHGVIIFKVEFESEGIDGSGSLAISDISQLQKVLSRFSGEVVFSSEGEVLTLSQSQKKATLALTTPDNVESYRVSDSISLKDLKLSTPQGNWDFSKGTELEIKVDWLKGLVADATVFDERNFWFRSKADILEVQIGLDVNQFVDYLEVEGLEEKEVDSYFEFGFQEVLSSLQGDNVTMMFLSGQAVLIRGELDNGIKYDFAICEAERDEE